MTTPPQDSNSSQPKIPNLLTSSRFSRPARGRGRAGPGSASSSTASTTSKATTNSDTTVRATDDDAAGSRLSAVDAGYLIDEFAEVFWDGGGGGGGIGGGEVRGETAGGAFGAGEGRERERGGMTVRPRRMPIINRGTYVRTTAIDKLVLDFITKHTQSEPKSTPSTTNPSDHVSASSPSTPTASKPTTPTSQHPDLHSAHPQPPATDSSTARVQIVSLGAGTDTRYFRLLQQYPHLRPQLIYHELDFPATTAKKIRAISRTPAIKALVFNEQEEDNIHITETTLTSPTYNIHALDLRALVPSPSPAPPPNTNSPPVPPAALPNLISTIPTLLLSECCLTYLPVPTSTALLTHFASTLLPTPTPLEVLMYEPLHPDDAFGRTMQANLAARGLSMPGVLGLRGLREHEGRLRGVLGGQGHGEQDGNGWRDGEVEGGGGCEVGFEGWTVKEIWDQWIDGAEKERLRRCEMVDEEEEWVLLAGHYGVIRAWRG